MIGKVPQGVKHLNKRENEAEVAVVARRLPGREGAASAEGAIPLERRGEA